MPASPRSNEQEAEGFQVVDMHQQLRQPVIERSAYDTASVVVAVVILFAVLQLELLSALLAGLLIAQIVHATLPLLSRLGVENTTAAKALALLLVTALLSVAIALGVFAVWRLTAGPENVVLLTQRIAEVIETARLHAPEWA